MNPYTTITRAQIRPCDLAIATRSDPFSAAASLTVLERARAYEAEAEVAWLLKQNGVKPHTVVSLVAMVQQAIGASLVRVGSRLASTSARETLRGTAPVNGMLRTVD